MGLITPVASYLHPNVDHLVDEVDLSCALYSPLYKLPGNVFYSREKNQHLCTNTGSIWTPNGRRFDGTDDKVDVGAGLDLNGELTIIAWFKTDTVAAGTRSILANANNDGSQSDYFLGINGTAGKLQAGWSNNAALLVGNTALSVSTWYHAAAIRSGVSGNWIVTLYLNSVLDNSIATTVNPNAVNAITAIGELGGYSGGLFFFKGLIDEVRLYSRVLFPIEITNHYLATRQRYK